MNPLRTFNPAKLDMDIPYVSPWGSSALIGRLSPREREVAELVAMGWPFDEIARKLGIARKTFDIYIGNIRERLGVTNHGIGRIWFAAQFDAKESPPPA